MSDEVREAVAAAFEAHETPQETEPQEPEVSTPENPEPEPEPEKQPVEPSPSEPVDQAASEPEQPAGEAEGTPKFLPAEEEASGEDDSQQTSEPDTGAVDNDIPAPVAWRGAAKQHWNDLPQPVREEAVRREREINNVLRESAETRQRWRQFEETIAPFRANIAASGVDPLTATRSLMQTEAGLRMGSAQQKAQIVADIVRQYGVDFQALDSALVGQAPQQGGQNGYDDSRLLQAIDQRLAPVYQYMGDQQQTAQETEQRVAEEAQTEVDRFAADPANVFFEDVRDDMSLIVSAAHEAGRQMTLEQAYRAAVNSNPKIAALEQKRQAAAEARKTTQSLESKKRAASSITAASPPQASAPTTLRGAIEEAWAKHGG